MPYSCQREMKIVPVPLPPRKSFTGGVPSDLNACERPRGLKILADPAGKEVKRPLVSEMNGGTALVLSLMSSASKVNQEAQTTDHGPSSEMAACEHPRGLEISVADPVRKEGHSPPVTQNLLKRLARKPPKPRTLGEGTGGRGKGKGVAEGGSSKISLPDGTKANYPWVNKKSPEWMGLLPGLALTLGVGSDGHRDGKGVAKTNNENADDTGKGKEVQKGGNASRNKRKCMADGGQPCNAGIAPRKYRGVRQRTWGRWVAETRDSETGKRIWLGSWKTAEEAAKAFDKEAIKMHGHKAITNIIPPPPPPTTAGNNSASRNRPLAGRLVL
ncbi:OLC1v1033376C1 [Oldenlandia corymbosa var. corymbosa]|uniref:OLC1v1033376C1 n=1 Tax=Oldenlandia corymbosa var. corymbosa TaxID=529605 RepID=A0AAV1CQT9_OLDCO|nr:OLC1v1033376C1 [Oldenlandia corymbosa var. corymbosa]